MKDDLYQRSRVLSKACLKIALVLPADVALCNLIRGNLVDSASRMAIKARGLMSPQAQNLFLQKLVEAKDAADASNYWLELIREENYLDSNIIGPILEESNAICDLFASAIRKIGPQD